MKGIQEAAEIVEALKDVEDLETGMKRMLDDLPTSKTYTFPRVPVYIREGNKKLYDSMSLSIGPYHHGREHLQAMEKHKWQYLQDLLSRRINKASLGDCLRKMKTLEEEARRCYSESIALKSDEFVKMMVLDSCFIIELFWKFHERAYFNMSWGFKYIPLDLLLIENQIPFFVIEELFKLVLGNAVTSSQSLNELIPSISVFCTSFVMQSPTKTNPGKIHHLLDYYYHCFVPTEEPSKSYHRSPLLLEKLISLLCSRFPSKSEKSKNSVEVEKRIEEPRKSRRSRASHIDFVEDEIDAKAACFIAKFRNPIKEEGFATKEEGFASKDEGFATKEEGSASFKSHRQNSYKKPNILIPSASVLHEAGVIFRKKDLPRSNLDITFRNGLMEIPFVLVDDFSKPLFANLIAFEQSMPNERRKLTSFFLLMDSLINTEKDVALLQQRGIIDNLLGSEEEVARFFNHLCVYADIDLDDHYFCDLFRHVNCYRDSRWNRYRARLAHDYFSNPWAILSLVAALILLALTFLQTFFAIDSYFHPP